MKITNVNVKIIGEENKNVKAMASFLIDECFAVKNVRIVKTEKALIVAMPSVKNGDNYEDIAHPINAETRKMVTERILNKMTEEILNILHENINIPEGYYLGHGYDDIQIISLFKEDDNEYGQGKHLNDYIIENYKIETLKELEKEILEQIENNNFGGK